MHQWTGETAETGRVRSSEFGVFPCVERERERERETSQVKFILPPSTKQIETFLFSIPELLKTQASLSAARERNGQVKSSSYSPHKYKIAPLYCLVRVVFAAGKI
jgi:hypothetical protein